MALIIKNVLSNAVKLFKDSDIEAASLDAEVLLAHVLHCRRTDLYVNSDRVLGEEDISNFMALVQKRVRRMPLQYITGHVEFMSLDFIVNESVLIPRPETEFIVESVIRKANLFATANLPQARLGVQETLYIFDVGTGCGDIAVSLAVNLKNVRIYASDISKDALKVARTNAQRHNVTEKISFLHGDLFDAFKDLKGEANFIISNPPYIAETERAELQPELINYEPELAIFGGIDGLVFFRRIFSEAPHWLAPNGYLVMEMAESQADSVIALIRENTHFDGLEIVKDLQKIDRVLIARKKGDKRNGKGEDSCGGGTSSPRNYKN